VVIPFLFIHETRLALRISNGIAILMLFAAGWAYARYSGGRPWWTSLAMIAIGVVCVATTIALGG
jgi:VIT1/CCC1 family predicted Fe2+/Mn2+ transporter